MSTRLLAAALLAMTFAIPACAVESEEEADEDMAWTDNALSGPIRAGDAFKTTARLNLREGGSKAADIILTMPKGAIVTALGTSPSAKGYYNISYEGREGWAHGAYLKATSTAPEVADGDDDDDDNAPAAGNVVSTGSCKASYYASGRLTANGESFNPNGLTAAHKTLPFNTKVRVTNSANGKSVVVRINDRGPFIAGRCLDLARGAFQQIASLSAGVATVKYEVLE